MIVEITGVIVMAFLLYLYFMSEHKYWEKRGVPAVTKHPFTQILEIIFSRRTMYEDIMRIYNSMPDKLIHGMNMCNMQQIIVKDPDVIRNICVKDFDHFVNHIDVFFKADPIFGRSLFAFKDQHWRDLRNIMSPVFTGSKLRGLQPMISKCGEQVCNHFANKYNEQADKIMKIDIEDVCTRFTNDVIATVAFGIEVDSVAEPDNAFYTGGQVISNFRMWRFFLIFFFPTISKILGIGLAPKYIYNFFNKIINESIRVRKEKNIYRPDLLHLLLEAQNQQMNEIKERSLKNENVSTLSKNLLTTNDISAQAFVFFFAGYTNISVILSFTAYELAVHPEIQKRLQNEISKVLKENGGKLDYDIIKKMTYLDMVVSETLRKWPPIAFLDRECTKPYKMESNDVTIDVPVGMAISIPHIGLHYDPKYFPNPNKFDPERFNDENREKMNPYVYMPFGMGPRICIAVRFVLLETKIFLAHLLNNFDIVVTEKTPIPMVLARGSVIKPKDGFHLGLKLRTL